MADRRWLYAWGLGSLAVGVASLLVPLYVVELGGDPFDLGALGAVAALVGTPGAIVWGRLADRTSNPREVIRFSLAGAGVFLAVMPLVSVVPAVIAVNAFLWLVFAAAGPVLTLLVVADVPEHAWNHEIASLNTFQGYGWAAGLLLGILWSGTVGRTVPTATSQRYLFVLCGVTAFGSALLLGRWMPTPTDRQLDRVEPNRVARALSAGRRGVRGATFPFNPNRLYWTTRNVHPRRLAERFTRTLAVYYLGVVLFFVGFMAFFAPLPLFLTGVGYSSDLVFGLYLVSSLGSAAFYGSAGRLSSRIDLRLLQTGALGVRALAMPLVAVAGSALAGALAAVSTGGLFVVIGVTWAVIAVTAGTIVTRIAPRNVRGEALGVYTALSTLAGGIGSVAGGLLAATFGFDVAFLVAGTVILASGGLVFSLRGISSRTRSRSEHAETVQTGADQ